MSTINRFLPVAAFAALVLAGCAGHGGTKMAHPLLGSGNGIDHATVLTRNLSSTSSVYTDSLGFTVTPYSKYENGFENSVVYFADTGKTYLELWGVHDPEAAAKTEQASVLSERDGLMWLTLHVGSTDATAAYLRARGHELFGPDNIGEDPWFYRLTGLERSTIPGRRIYFIEYNEPYYASKPKNPEKNRLRQTHANTAESLRSVWIAVKDIDAAVAAYQGIGFSVKRGIELPHLKAKAQELEVGGGTILLVHSEVADSPVSAFLGTHGDRMMGASIKVANLATAQSFLAGNAKLSLTVYPGVYGRSILVPAERAGGTWLEFFE